MQLTQLGTSTVKDLRALSSADLTNACGATTATMLVEMSYGRDSSVVLPSGPPKSITCEDSFKSCTTMAGVATVVCTLAIYHVAFQLAAFDVFTMSQFMAGCTGCTGKWSTCMQLKVIVPDLAIRISEEFAENQRWPRSFSVKWRVRGPHYKRSAASAPLPAEFHSSAAQEALVRGALSDCCCGVARAVSSTRLPGTS